jgi:flagellin-like protein
MAWKKRGLSPVIATVLLIAIAIVIAVIIFLWARSFVGEQTQKFGEPIDRSCAEIDFDAEVVDSNPDVIDVINRGNVPLYGVKLRKKGSGTIEDVGAGELEGVIQVGETGQIDVRGGSGVSEGDEVIVVPMIWGESGEFRKTHTCSDDYGVETTVIV